MIHNKKTSDRATNNPVGRASELSHEAAEADPRLQYSAGSRRPDSEFPNSEAENADDPTRRVQAAVRRAHSLQPFLLPKVRPMRLFAAASSVKSLPR